MASMKPCFRENGRVTAATSSQTSDGAAFLVLMSRDKAAEMGIRPLASFLGFCVGGLDPAYMGLGPSTPRQGAGVHRPDHGRHGRD